MPLRTPLTRNASYLLAGLTLFLALQFHAIAPLFMGLLVYQMIQLAASVSHIHRLAGKNAHLVALILIATCVIAVLCLFALGLYWVSASEANSLPNMLQQLESINAALKKDLPPWLIERLPNTVEDWQIAINNWASGHVAALQEIGTRASRVLAQILVAMVVGALIAICPPMRNKAPLAADLLARSRTMANAFRNIVFAQVRISALNTVFTACYLLILLPLLGHTLPFTKALIALTFFAGLLPVVGNLISNTAIVISSLSITPLVAASSLAYLIIIHKVEYFLNARIIGGRISAKAWELLLAMLVLEAIFGLQGVVAAPVFYAYLKDELKAAQLV